MCIRTIQSFATRVKTLEQEDVGHFANILKSTMCLLDGVTSLGLAKNTQVFDCLGYPMGFIHVFRSFGKTPFSLPVCQFASLPVCLAERERGEETLLEGNLEIRLKATGRWRRKARLTWLIIASDHTPYSTLPGNACLQFTCCLPILISDCWAVCPLSINSLGCLLPSRIHESIPCTQKSLSYESSLFCHLNKI